MVSRPRQVGGAFPSGRKVPAQTAEKLLELAAPGYAAKGGEIVGHHCGGYVDEAESGRIADRPQFRNMIDEGGASERGRFGCPLGGSGTDVAVRQEVESLAAVPGRG